MSGPWRRIDDGTVADVELTVDGAPVRAFEAETVATLLLRLGRDHFGPHPKTGEPLAPWCLMGSCFGCLCTVDGRPGTQACLVPVAPGLEIRTGASAPPAGAAS